MKRKIEQILIFTVVLLGLWSIIVVLSTTINTPEYRILYIKQAAAFVAGLCVMLIMRNFSYKILEELSPILFVVSVLMLVAVLVFGVEINGSRRWFDLGIFHFQPVEFAKFTTIIFVAMLLEKYNSTILSVISVAVVAGLVITQPDAGSSLIFFPVLAVMLIISRQNTNWMIFAAPFALITIISLFIESYLNVKGTSLLNTKSLLLPVIITVLITAVFSEFMKINRALKKKYLLFLIAVFWISIGVGIAGSKMLRVYQKKRIVSFMMPEMDPLGAGYNVRQSLLAVGSGRMLGKGLFGGTQTQLGFLPVRHTDFIFASIGEELGFAGAAAMLFMLGILLWQCVRVMERSEDYGGRLIAGGIFTLILVQVIINIGVTLGLLPVIGIQLPLVSYGGTGMVFYMTLIGVILNINRKTEIIGR
ncbi:MAG: FtsW/RodA/SpoVE family cell cycle protein [Elusimicrobiota bacterium]